ncbi:type IV secretory system conjugative DNA transfer family protein [Hyphobacterium indicum]|uniref:type IV secretory system conjugative DNA transfer family protein n=1 Tax=Hyphobacterium indicum TaxID=2162714 RepID=UPI000D651DB2|nr:type IV secretory system conjugative DNA transfer family protein [Hyphobacterium indicum]
MTNSKSNDISARLGRIDEKFDTKEGGYSFKIDFNRMVDGTHAKVKATLHRELAAMPPREREMLRLFEYFAAAGVLKNSEPIYGALVWGDGKAEITSCSYLFDKEVGQSVKDFKSAIEWVFSFYSHTVDSEISAFLGFIDRFTKKYPDTVLSSRVLARLRGGGAWATASDLTDDFAPDPSGLLLGIHEGSDTPVRFSGEGSLITIASPGTGKTQAQVLPNLLEWRGAAIVLDVKGEIFEATARWRAENGFPVYRFAPLDPDESHSFNPLKSIRNTDDFLWEDSRFLASMLLVPNKKSNDPFWETKAQDLITASVAAVCALAEPDERSMAQVLDYLYRVEWEEFLAILKSSSIRAMMRAGHSIENMTEKTLDSVLQTAQSALSAWEGPRVERVITGNDWEVSEFQRTEHPPTLYITLRPGEIDPYRSLLRVMVAQHLRGLMQKVPDGKAPPVLFMLDEVPRLGNMPPIEEALEVGRQYGIKLWMFAQSLGQIRNIYPNADGMIGNCRVQCYMNPALHDGTADHLSKSLGMFESPLDGSRQRVVEPQALAGPEFKDLIVGFSQSMRPFKMKKQMAFETEPYSSRLR